MNVTKSVLKKLTRDLKENQKEAVKFICDCFDDMLDDDRFIAWLANGVGYKPSMLMVGKWCRLQTMLIETNFEG